MKHLEPSQNPEGNPNTIPRYVSSFSMLRTALVGILLVVGMGYGMQFLWYSSIIDNVSDTKKAELVTAFSQIKSVPAELVLEQDQDKALQAMSLAEPQRRLLKNVLSTEYTNSQQSNALATNNTRLVWITLWDFATQDGDIVHISSAGYEMDITLQKSQARIAVPIDETNSITVTGVHDGGGGITLAIKTADMIVTMPILETGEVLSLPFAF